MRYSEICKLLQLLVTLALVLSGKEESRVSRVKRLATPNYDQEVYESMAKYVVSIRSRSPKRYFGDNHFCGGCIISPRFVISAAICVMESDHKILLRSRVLMVVAGTPNRLKIVTGQTLNVPVADIYVPGNYTVYNTNNIAIMKLAYDLPSESKHIGIINLPTQPPDTDLIYRVLGWGRVFKGGPLASRLLYIDVTLQKRNVCESMIKNFKPEMLCAGNMNSSNDANPCLGDSGDPLLLNLTVYGIASYGLGCGYGSMPSVYTDVWYHMDWINSVMNRNFSPKYQLLPHYMFLLSIIVIFPF